MKANYNVTGEDRKQMVAIISREAGVQAVYTWARSDKSHGRLSGRSGI